MKHGSLKRSDDQLRKCPAENFVELFHDPPFRVRGSFLLQKNVESKLGPKNFVFDLLKIQKFDFLFLKLVDTGVPPLRCRLENRNCRGLHHKFVMQSAAVTFLEPASERGNAGDNCCGMR